MGNATSKAAKSASKLSATSSTARKYPTRSPTTTNRVPPAEPMKPGPTVHPSTPPSAQRTAAIEQDAMDPDLAARARQLGPVVPNPTMSNSSTFNQAPRVGEAMPGAGGFQGTSPGQTIYPDARRNAAIGLLEARRRLAEEAEEEFGRVGKRDSQGRRFVDVVTLRQALVMRDRGVQGEEIERRLGLRRGVVGMLGRKGVVGVGDEM